MYHVFSTRRGVETLYTVFREKPGEEPFTHYGLDLGEVTRAMIEHHLKLTEGTDDIGIIISWKQPYNARLQRDTALTTFELSVDEQKLALDNLQGFYASLSGYRNLRKMSIYDLPWSEVNPNHPHQTYRAAHAFTRVLRKLEYPESLTDNIRKHGREHGVTVGEVWDLFARHEAGGTKLNIREFGKGNFEMAYEAFSRVGLELPKVKLERRDKWRKR